MSKIQHLGQEPMLGALDEVRKIKVYGARWPDDGDDDRALRHFRKYMKVSVGMGCDGLAFRLSCVLDGLSGFDARSGLGLALVPSPSHWI